MPVQFVHYDEEDYGVIITLGENNSADMLLLPNYTDNRGIISIVEGDIDREIGEEIKDFKKDKNLIDLKPVVILDFYSEKSIDTMIKALEIAKKGFKTDYKNTPTADFL